MALTRREFAIFGVLLVCVPLQLFLTREPSMSNELKTHYLDTFISEIQMELRTIFSPAMWTILLKRSIEYLTGYSSWYPDDHKPLGECPAVEVLRYKYPNNYFAKSVIPRRTRPSKVHYRVGQVVKHQIYGYSGVIIGWDDVCKAPETWIEKMHGDNANWRYQPSYTVLVDVRYRSEAQETYVAQENLEPIKEKVTHPELGNYFDFFDGAQYIPQPWLQAIYPLD